MKYSYLLIAVAGFCVRGVFAMDLTRNPRELIGNYTGRQTRHPARSCQAVTKGVIRTGPNFGDDSVGKVSVDLSNLSVDYVRRHLFFTSKNNSVGINIADLSTDPVAWTDGNNTLSSGNFGPQHSKTVSTNVVSPFSIVSKYDDKNFELAMWAIPYVTMDSEEIGLYVNPQNTNEFRLIVKLNSSYPKLTSLRGKQTLDCTFTRQ